MVVRKNPSRSAVFKILRPARLAPTTIASSKSLKSPFFPILMFGLNFSRLSSPHTKIQIKLRWALFVTYTIIQSIMRSQMFSLHLTHPSAHTPGAVGSRHCGARQWWSVTKYNYFVTVLKYIFQVSVLYWSSFILSNFYFYFTTFQSIRSYFLLHYIS